MGVRERVGFARDHDVILGGFLELLAQVHGDALLVHEDGDNGLFGQGGGMGHAHSGLQAGSGTSIARTDRLRVRICPIARSH